MDSTYAAIWPDDVPWSYWSLDKLETASIEGAASFLGLQLENEFLAAAFFGILAIWFFATKTFNQPSFENDEATFRVLQAVEPSELRNRTLVRRSYVLYAGALIAIYLSLTFFGSIVFGLVNVIPNPAGLKVDVGAINFDSPAWPITLALGMIGLIPMLKPVEASERWLRRWAHKRAGIPVKLHQYAAEIRAELDDLEMKPRQAPSWVSDEMSDAKDVHRTMQAAAQLERLRHWLKDEEAYWPDAAERAPLRVHEREELAAAQILLDEFRTLIAQPAPDPTDVADDEEESPLARRNRLLNKWMTLSADLQKHRNELVALLVVHAERDRDYDEIDDPVLEALVKRVFDRPKPTQGPEFGLGWLVWLALPIYAIAVALDFHSLFGNVDRNPFNILLTAGLETLKLAILLWLPIAVLMSYRYAKIDGGSWQPVTIFKVRREAGPQLSRVILLSLIVPLISLLLLGLLWSVVIAQNFNRLRELFLEQATPFGQVYASMILIPFLFAILVLSNVDADDAEDKIWRAVPRWGWGAVAAALTIMALILHSSLWLNAFFASQSTDHEWSLCAGLSFGQCIQATSPMNLIIYPLFVFLSFTVLMPDRKTKHPPFNPRTKRRPTEGLSSAMVALSAILILAPGTGYSSDTNNSPRAVGDNRLDPVRVGFRKDAEPFSYKIGRNREVRYTGFVADLCHKVFNGSAYAVEAVEVTAQDRFKLLRPVPPSPIPTAQGPRVAVADKLNSGTQTATAEFSLQTAKEETPQEKSSGLFEAPPEDAYIDVLCDPVTLRYSLNDGRSDGVFSPIVFITGVSYMRRRVGGQNDTVTLAYVSQVSAAEIAVRLCRDDAFRLYNEESERSADDLSGTCRTPNRNDFVGDTSLLNAENASGCVMGGKDKKRYQVCAFQNHEQLIEWFCSDFNGSRQRIYVGDQDIIEGKLTAWLRSGRDCGSNVERNKEVFTYEPYAILISKADADLIAHVQRRVYEIFSNRSEAMGLFTTHFPGKSLSVPLANLFLLNGVEKHTCLQVAHDDECPTIVQPQLRVSD